MIVDAHMHTFRNEREGLTAQGGSTRAGYIGQLDEVATLAARARVDRFVALPAAPVEIIRRFLRGRADPLPDEEIESRLVDYVRELNDWACAAAAGHAHLVSAVAADATIDAAAMRAELETRIGDGTKIIKIHPALNFVLPTHPGYRRIYELASDAGAIVVAHGGGNAEGIYEGDIEYCAPAHYAPVLAEFPHLRLIVAHLAQPHRRELIELAAVYPNLFTDLSFVIGLAGVSDSRLRDDIGDFGFERVLFGSDFPYFDPEICLDRLDALGLGATQWEAITAGNAVGLFDLE